MMGAELYVCVVLGSPDLLLSFFTITLEFHNDIT